MPGRIHIAEQHTRKRCTAAIARIPRFQHARDVLQPWHQHRPARFEHDNRARIGSGDRRDQRILLSRKRQIGNILAFAHPLLGEHDGDIGAARSRRRMLHIFAVVEYHTALREPRLDGLERRRRIEDEVIRRHDFCAVRQHDHRAAHHVIIRRAIADGQHLRRAAARQHADIGMFADHGNAALACAERKDAALVLEQYHAFFRGDLCDEGIVRHGVGLLHRGIVEQPYGEHAPQDAVNHVVQPCGRDGPVLDRLQERRAEIFRAIETGGRFLVEPIVGGVDRAVYRAPIRQHPAGIMPVAFQHVVQQEGILAGINGVHFFIGAHDRAGRAMLDRDLECEQIGFARRRFVDDRIQGETPALLIVESVMFFRRHDVIALNAARFLAGHGACQQRVLAGIFEGAPAAGIAREVERAVEHDIEAAGARFGTECRADLKGGIRIPARGIRKSRRKRRRRISRAQTAVVGDPHACIRLDQGRNSQTRNPGHITRRAEEERAIFRRRGLRPDEVDVRAVKALNQLELFVHRHLLLDQVRPRIGSEGRIHPGRGEQRDRHHLGGLRRRGRGAGLRRRGRSGEDKQDEED